MYKCLYCRQLTFDFSPCCPACSTANSLCRARSRQRKPSAERANILSAELDLATGDDCLATPLRSVKIPPDEVRISCGIAALDATFGDDGTELGFAEGSCILLSGDPGSGKSTLVLQMGQNFSAHGPFCYLSAEEAPERIARRAKRVIGPKLSPNFHIFQSFVWEEMVQALDNLKARAFLVDSVNVITTQADDGRAGSVRQLKSLAPQIQRYCASRKALGFIICHVTKDGDTAGPKSVEHDVDVLAHLYNMADEAGTRKLRLNKNRFGVTHIETYMKMTKKGLKPVEKPLPIDPGSITVAHNLATA